MTLGVLFLLFQHVVLDMPSVNRNPHTSPADIELGKKLYKGRCAGCHGPTGDGGKGTNLAAPMLPRAQTDLALYRTIRYGLPDTEMPAHNMTPREIWQIGAYVRTFGSSGDGSRSGNRARGEVLVRGKGGCLTCHVMNGEGGHLGPSLSDVGVRRSPSWLRAKLSDPSQDVGNFSQVRLVTRDGKTLRGVRLNEDTWSIQLRDMTGGLHSFWKQDLKDLKLDGQTLMPSYGTQLTPQELDDVVAYLSSFGVRQ